MRFEHIQYLEILWRHWHFFNDKKIHILYGILKQINFKESEHGLSNSILRKDNRTSSVAISIHLEQQQKKLCFMHFKFYSIFGIHQWDVITIRSHKTWFFFWIIKRMTLINSLNLIQTHVSESDLKGFFCLNKLENRISFYYLIWFGFYKYTTSSTCW